MKNVKFKSFLIFVITVLILFFLLKDNFGLIMKEITDANIIFLIFA